MALRSTFSPDLQFIDYGMYAGAYTKRNQGSQATAWYEKTTILNWVWDNMVTYNFDLMKDHHFDLTGVYSMTEYQNEFMRGEFQKEYDRNNWPSDEYTHEPGKTYYGDIAEAFDSGGGTQLELPMSVESLKELGMIHEV